MDMDLIGFFSKVAIGAPGFLAAIVFHEAAHAWVALKFGDNTAQSQGRLSLNPAVHYDLLGTVICPLLGALLGGILFGWAKPVPVNPRNFKHYKQGVFWVSFAGPLANVAVAIVAAFMLALLQTKVSHNFFLYREFGSMLLMAISINLVIAVFNLIPFPPLDGAKMVSTFLDYETERKFNNLQRYGILFLLVLWMTPLLRVIIFPALHFGDGLLRVFINILA